MEIIVGTYERYILGYKLVKAGDGFELQLSFSTQAHLGSVRCLASCGKYLVSGSTDENIQIFSLSTRKEVGTLTQHGGTISCLKFFEDSYLFSGSEDNTICIWSTSNWQCQKTLKGHKNHVVDLSVHPSGKLLLSVAKDKTLKTWNLVKGRSAYVTNIKSVAQFIKWAPDGVHFVVVFDTKFDVYSTLTAAVVYSAESKQRFYSLDFLTGNILTIAESGNISLHHIENKCLLYSFAAHENRIKSIVCICSPSGEDAVRWLVSVSSDGLIKVWKVHLERVKEDPELVTYFDTTCRPICLTVWNASQPQSKESKSQEVSLKQDLKVKCKECSDHVVKPKRKKLCKKKN